MTELFKNEKENDTNTEARIVRFFCGLTSCLIYGLIGAGCLTGIVFLCKVCYNIIWGG